MFWPALDSRRRQPELMDQPGLDPTLHHDALRGLAAINLLSNSAGILWRPVRELALHRRSPLTVLDIACGGGDLLSSLWWRARKSGIELRLAGCDCSPVALEYAARQASAQEIPIDFFVWDALNDPLPGTFDVVTASLFLHHLDEPEAILLLRRMKQLARALILVNDLERGPLGWLLSWLGTRVLSRSRVVHVDGPLSVEGAFTCAEARGLARQAELDGVRLERRWPCRWLLTWARREPEDSSK